MTFPQPSSVEAVLGLQDSFRLTTELMSGGDLYESEVGAQGFAIGPNSDIGNAMITYLDDGSPSGVSSAIISPDRNFVGRIGARNETRYPTSARRGRILISPSDIYDTTFRPDGFDDARDTISFQTPVLDVIQYFNSVPSVAPPRSDRSFPYQYFEKAPDEVDGVTWLLVPSYGRKSGFFTFFNIGNGITTTRVRILGVKMSISSAPGPTGAYQTEIFDDQFVQGTGGEFIYQASVHGTWDMLAIGLGSGGAGFGYAGGPFPTSVLLSDDAL